MRHFQEHRGYDDSQFLNVGRAPNEEQSLLYLLELTSGGLATTGSRAESPLFVLSCPTSILLGYLAFPLMWGDKLPLVATA